MDVNEFERNMDSARALLSGPTSDIQATSNADNTSSSKPMKSQQFVPSDANDSAKQSQISSDFSVAKSSSQEDLPIKDRPSMTKNMSISDFEEKGAATILKEDNIDNIFQEFPYVFASVGDLTLRDVEDLLNNYKQLVFKYVCLAKGLGVTPLPSNSSLSQEQDQSLVKNAEGSEPDSVVETDEHHTEKHDRANESSHSDIVTSESEPSQEDASASLQREERGEVLVSSREKESEGKVPQEEIAEPSSYDHSSEAVTPPTKESRHDVQ